MQIVIDIPEDAYRQIRNWGVPTDELRRKIYDMIDNSTPLPEHHGRLIDEAEVIKSLFYYVKGTKTIGQCIDDTPTIIEGSDSE